MRAEVGNIFQLLIVVCRRDPSPFSLSDIEGFGEQFLKVLGLRSEPEDSLLNRDDALSGSLSGSPDERRRGLVDAIEHKIEQLKDLKDSFKNTIH